MVQQLARVGWWGLLLLGTLPLAAAEKSEAQKKAVTKMAEVDADFAYQGEYAGGLATWLGRQAGRGGLQVIARGAGRFEATLYRGGLPGAGWDGQARDRLSGELSGGVLTLRNENWSIASDGVTATVADAQGRRWASCGRSSGSVRRWGRRPLPEP